MNTMSRLGLRAALAATTILGTALVAAAPAAAQEVQASLRGTITAQPGNPVTQVSIVETRTGIRRTATLDAGGRYNFASLRPGVYRLEITLQQGTRNSDEFQLNVSQNAALDIDLNEVQPAQPAQTEAGETTGTGTSTTDEPETGSGDIIVSGNRLRSLEGGEIGKVISQRTIEQLPQNNRNFLAFADLAPGVRFIEGANGDSRIQGGGQDSRTVNVFIDGVGQKDFVLKNGLTGQDSTQGNPFPQLAIGEYRVLSSNYKAEFDQVSSVAITAITKSGTNQFHGEGFIDYTDRTLRDARAIELFGTGATGRKVPTKDYQFGGALGGPIVKDVAHFFVSYEGKRREIPVDIQPGNGTTVGSLPTQFQPLFGTFSRDFNEDLYFGKIDVSPTDRDLVEISGKYRDEDGSQLNSGLNTQSTANSVRVKEKRGTLRWEHTGADWVNDLKVSYQDVQWAPTPLTFADGQLYQSAIRNADGSVSRFDLFRTGGGANFQQKGQKGWTVQNDATWTGLRGHTFKTGVKISWVKLRTLEQNLFNPLYTFNLNRQGNSDFNTTVPYRLQFGAASGPGGLTSAVRSDNFQYGAYVQDDWDVTDRLTVNLGLRWDYERTPAYLDFVHPADAVNAVSPAVYPNLVGADYNIADFISTGNNRKTFKNAWQPRIGFSYELDDAGRFAVFGGYGRSYDRNQFDFLQQELSVGSFQTRTFNFQTNDPLNTCNPSATCVPFDPVYLTAAGRAQLLASAPGGGRELRFIRNDLKVPYSDQFSLGIRGRFDPVELEAGYSHIEGKDGFAYLLGNRRPGGSFFQNPPPAGATPNSPFGFAPPGFGSIIIGTNGLENSADSAYFKLTKRYTQASPWSLDATYTFTEAEENRQFLEVFSLDYPQLDDYPTLRSSGVPRHRFITAGSVDTPIGVTLSMRFTIESPLYQKAVVDSATPFRRDILGTFRDSLGDQWGRRQLDFAFTKYVPFGFITDDFRVRFRADILNVLNDRNYTDYNNDRGDTTRTASSPTIYGERTGFATGGNAPRTVKLSAGFSF